MTQATPITEAGFRLDGKAAMNTSEQYEPRWSPERVEDAIRFHRKDAASRAGWLWFCVGLTAGLALPLVMSAFQ